MQRRVIAAVIAVALTVASILLVVRYVTQADARALATVQPMRVLAVTAPIAAGQAPVLGETVGYVDLPTRAVAPDAVTDAAALDGLVATVPLLPGEQVLLPRFAPPGTIQTDEVPVPVGFSEVSLILGPDRGLGTLLTAGDTVGFVLSHDGTGATVTVLNHVLVSRLALSTAAAEQTEEGPDGQWSSMSYLVTFAAPQDDLEKLIWSMEFGKVWLTLQMEDSTAADLIPVTATTLLPGLATQSPAPEAQTDE